MALLNWAEYRALHNAVNEAEFEAAEKRAEIEVSQVVGPIHWAETIAEGIAGAFFEDQLKECLARLIDYNTDVASKTGAGAGVTSVSNDGYSETYATALQTASAAEAEKEKTIRAWLSGTGLARAY